MIARRDIGIGIVATAALVAGGFGSSALLAQEIDATTLEIAPLTTIGGVDDRPAYSFSRVVTGAVLSSTEVAVVDRLAGEIRVFDLGGAHLRTFGRTGQGPGEFQFLRNVDPFSADRLAAWDFLGKRLAVFGYDGRHFSTERVEMEPSVRLWAHYVGSFSDGSFVLRNDPNEMVLKDEPAGYRIDPTSFVRYSESGDELETLCVVPGPQRRLYHDDGRWGLEERLLERSVVGAIVDDMLHCGSTESLELDRVNRVGEILSPILVDWESVPVSRAEVERLRELARDRIVLAQERRARQATGAPFALPDNTEFHLEQLRRREAYDTRPAFRSIVGDSEGTLWIEEYGAPDREVARWAKVIGSEVSGWLEVPADEVVLDIDHGVLLTRSEDELGVHSVRIWRIVDPDA